MQLLPRNDGQWGFLCLLFLFHFVFILNCYKWFKKEKLMKNTLLWSIYNLYIIYMYIATHWWKGDQQIDTHCTLSSYPLTINHQHSDAHTHSHTQTLRRNCSSRRPHAISRQCLSVWSTFMCADDLLMAPKQSRTRESWWTEGTHTYVTPIRPLAY